MSNKGKSSRSCEGDCKEHTGNIRHVRVVDPEIGKHWGWFFYCENAFQIDKERGFDLLDYEAEDSE